MTNKKFKLAAMSLATAVAVSTVGPSASAVTYYLGDGSVTVDKDDNGAFSYQVKEGESADGSNCWVSVKQFSKNDTATACQDWLRSTRLGRGSIKSHVRTVKVLGMGLFAFQERVHLLKGVTH